MKLNVDFYVRNLQKQATRSTHAHTPVFRALVDPLLRSVGGAACCEMSNKQPRPLMEALGVKEPTAAPLHVWEARSCALYYVRWSTYLTAKLVQRCNGKDCCLCNSLDQNKVFRYHARAADW